MKTLLSWSSGKDSAWALHVLRLQQEVEVVGLLTSLNAAAERVSMHAVRRTLLAQQATAVGLPLYEIPLPFPCSNADYETAMTKALAAATAHGVQAVAFGDLYLEDVRRYREERMLGSGIAPLFPLWGLPTRALAEEMITSGCRARLTCVDPRVLPAAFAGRLFDRDLLAEIPAGVDPCGENGEFHSFAFDGPAFRQPVPIAVGETVERDGFVFTDLLPA